MNHECQCPGAGRCPVFAKDMTERHHQICSGRFPVGAGVLTDSVRLAYVEKWAAAVALPMAPAAAKAKRVRLPLLPPCSFQGDAVPGCKTCGGEGSVIRYCDHPDDVTGDYDRCTRGRNNGRDPLIRSCLSCPGYAQRPTSGGSTSSAT